MYLCQRSRNIRGYSVHPLDVDLYTLVLYLGSALDYVLMKMTWATRGSMVSRHVDMCPLRFIPL